MRSLVQGQDLNNPPYKGMLDVLSCDLTARAFGRVPRKCYKGSDDVGWQSDRAPVRRQAVLAVDMLGAG